MEKVLWEKFCNGLDTVQKENQQRLAFFFSFYQDCRIRGISILPLKGLDWLLRAYPQAGFRPMLDIDLLIRPQDIQSVREILNGRGLRRVPDFEALTYEHDDPDQAWLELDLVWDIWYHRNLEDVWSRRVTVSLDEGDVELMHPEDALLYAIVYGVAHRGCFSRDFIQDIRWFLERQGSEIDWKRWRASVQKVQMEAAVYHGLSYLMANDIREIPGEVCSELRPHSLRARLAASFYRRFVNTEEKSPKSYLKIWFEYPGMRGKWKLFQQKFLPSPLQMEIRFGKMTVWKYAGLILFRPFYILFRSFLILTRDLKKLFQP